MLCHLAVPTRRTRNNTIFLQRGLGDAENETLLLLHLILDAEVANIDHNTNVHCRHI